MICFNKIFFKSLFLYISIPIFLFFCSHYNVLISEIPIDCLQPELEKFEPLGNAEVRPKVFTYWLITMNSRNLFSRHGTSLELANLSEKVRFAWVCEVVCAWLNVFFSPFPGCVPIGILFDGHNIKRPVFASVIIGPVSYIENGRDIKMFLLLNQNGTWQTLVKENFLGCILIICIQIYF